MRAMMLPRTPGPPRRAVLAIALFALLPCLGLVTGRGAARQAAELRRLRTERDAAAADVATLSSRCETQHWVFLRDRDYIAFLEERLSHYEAGGSATGWRRLAERRRARTEGVRSGHSDEGERR
jgi:hypothetical protein